MSNEDWRIQISPKTPSGTLINVRGNTAEEVQALLSGVQELVVLIVGLENALGAVHNLSPLLTGSSIAPPTQAQSLPPASFPVTQPISTQTGPTCQHGARKYISGNKNGKPWAMYACPTQKGAPDQCPPVWA